MENYKIVINPKTKWNEFNLAEVWAYRDLVFLFVKRNFVTKYKQTILGPLWLVLVPLINTVISTFVFGTIAELPSDGVPYFLFYMCGHMAWSYFANSLNSTSSTFTGNANVFGKVYFPRLIVPISVVITGLLNLVIDFVMFLVFWVYYKYLGANIVIGWTVLLVPLLVLQMAMLGLGLGIIISSMTTKYRDLTVLVSFGISLWMYLTPIIYSTSSLNPTLQNLCLLNPMAPVVEIFRYALLGVGNFSPLYWGISWIVTIAVMFVGIVLFNKVEKTFMDTV